jgi:hypothetical protein
MKGMRAKTVNEKFVEDSDPIKDMGVGMTDAERVLYYMIELFGDRIICSQSPKGKYTIERQFYPTPTEINQLSDLSNVNLNTIRKYMYYTDLLSDVYGDAWYFDDIDLVQGDRTIVSFWQKFGMTFKQLIENIKKSPRLRIKKH